MVKRALKSAIGIGVGATLGGVLLPRLLFPAQYNETFPPIWQQVLLYFAVSYAVSFLTYLLIEWLKSKSS